MSEDQQYPRGQLSDDDKGALMLSLSAHEGKVVLHFGKFVSWIGLGKDDIAKLAPAIEQYAESAQKYYGIARIPETPDPALRIENNTVVFQFPMEVPFMCMSPERIRRFVESLREHANRLTSSSMERGPG
jgi:hypothetical protein